VTVTVPDRARAPTGLDWRAFSERYFPDRHRHDLEALTAYAAYRRTGTVAPAASPDAEEAGALETWEDEGGPPQRDPL
jgi:phytoene/squalene synthetase